MKKTKVIIVFFTLLFILLFQIKYCIISVNGDSMLPTFSDGEILIAKKYCKIVKNGDIIAFKHDNKIYIKRVIAQFGDIVKVDESQGLIYVNESVKVTYNPCKSLETYSIELGKDEYFVVGDNFNNSVDSRSEEIGLVKKSSIVAIISE